MPSKSSRPQSYDGCCTPRPRNDRPAKDSSAPPAPIVALTTSGSEMLGSTCRKRIRTRPTPATRAASTKSRDETEATRVRVRRPIAGAPASPIAKTAPVAPTPKTTAKKRASSMPGNATAMLTPALTSRPLRRPSTKDAVPSSSPMTTAIAVAASASSTESRVATRVRKKMSRPRLSVPAQWSADGPARMLAVSMASASSLHRIGATTASSSTPTVRIVAVSPTGVRMTLLRRDTSVLPDHRARVEQRERDVDQGVDEQHADAVHEHDGLHDLVVLVEDRRHDGAAEPGPGEDVLDQHRPRHHRAEDQAADGERRGQGVGQGVAEVDGPLRQPLGARRTHEVGVEHADHLDPDDAGQDRGRADRQGQHGQDVRRGGVVAGDREPLQADAEHVDQDDGDDEVGDDPEHDAAGGERQLGAPAVAATGENTHRDPQRHRDDDREHEGQQ